MIATCDCNHPGQDELHGKGKRVFNPCVKGYRCTVCKAVKEKKQQEDTKKK